MSARAAGASSAFPLAVLLAVDCAAWAALAHASGRRAGYCGEPLSDWTAPGGLDGPGTRLGGLLLMQAAMMIPLLAGPIVRLWSVGRARRRVRTIALFVAGHQAVWALAGALLMAVAAAVSENPGAAPLIAIALAAVWQITPAKRICLENCHRPPPPGPEAPLGALGHGASHAVWCVGACWALMLPPMVVAGFGLFPMAAVAAFLFAERWISAPPPRGWALARARSLEPKGLSTP